ncbi:Uncharacterised protein [Actinomyces bovis]|uniref:Suppressor of fused protein (SUFU) n=1 Tax=Actinomyces bovis TaxID=1658 RepID=A0ABY1VQT5_9ACTO|nr:hypothetical protein [Actinomyces bovis]SPT55038.1 Uncharacterised protein [Actinomyces bovis]VEG56196.1 Uncharacterised protein [Actinomyces israelii]
MSEQPEVPGGDTVRMGLPFNGVVPLWYEGENITWHHSLQADLSTLLGLGHIQTTRGPSPTPPGWSEQVEIGTLRYDDDGAPTLFLQAAAPTGRRAVNQAGDGAPIPLSGPLSPQEYMQSQVDDVAMAVHVGRLMIRAARDSAILLFTLRAPRDPEAHHLLSMPAEVDDDLVMHFHLGTLLEMEGGAWDQATRQDGMSLLDLDVPFEPLLVAGSNEGEPGLDAGGLVDMARPVVDCLLKPGFPFALGYSFILPEDATPTPAQ